MNDRVLIVVVAAVSIATVAVGLRIGAGDITRAAIVVGASPSHGHAAWQLRTEEDDGHARTMVPVRFTMSVRARGVETSSGGETNVDGVAEVSFDREGLAWGDDVEVTVEDDQHKDLARGKVTWPTPAPRPSMMERAFLRPSRLEGPLHMRVAVLGGAVAPGGAGHVWVTLSATGEPPRNPRIEATPDLGVEIARPWAKSLEPACTNTGVLEVVARGLTAGVALHAKDDLGREGDWYGALPVAAGALLVTLPHPREPGPAQVTITSASARTLAYVEVDDAEGRADAQILTLAGEPPHAEVPLALRLPGKSFLVVSGEPDGATNVSGATRALPVWVGASAPCEGELAETTAQSFPRFVALDGFQAKRAALAVKRKKGRLIALGALALGSFVETLLLLRAARAGRRAPTAPKRSGLDVVVVLMLSLMGFVLLFALVEWTSR